MWCWRGATWARWSLPTADVKVFLTASVEERARRRQLQLQAQGVTQPLEELVADITARDAYDSGRALAPLRKADDAVEIDTTGMTIEQVIAAVCDLRLARSGSVPRQQMAALPPHPQPARQLALSHSVLDAPSAASGVVPRARERRGERTATAGRVVVACNHRSNLDPFFLGCACSREIHFMAKAEVWRFKPLGLAGSTAGYISR